MPTKEQHARVTIDRLLHQAGWHLCDAGETNIFAHRGVAVREFPLQSGHGFADYLLYVDGAAAGVIEAKKEGHTLGGVEIQAEKYSQGLPEGLPAWRRPLPFAYQSTGLETRFTNGLDPAPRARPVFAFHRPELLAEHLGSVPAQVRDISPIPDTFLDRLRHMPLLKEESLWTAQIKAITNLEKSLRENRPRALIQMATGSGKTFTAISAIYRLIKFAGARRVLFLVDRGNLGDQTLKEFQQYVSPYNNFKFSEEYIVQRLSSNTLDTTARVCICTIQRMFSMLKGKELPPEDDEVSVQGLESLFKEQPPIEYNPAIPIETFDIIVTDECHRSIYNLWAQVLEYFDAYLIGLTATPNKQTFGFFQQNLVMEYSHEHAVADGVNVNYDVYRIKTQITEGGSKVEAGYYVEQQDRETREKRWQELDEDLEYQARQLDLDVVTPDQIRTVVGTFRDKLFSEIFPGRTEVPKTLFFAKDDNHAENIVEILREEFGKGNDFAQKITYRTTGATPQQLIKAFRNSYFPRIAVTVDMIATGTDIKPVEIVVFMRAVKSRSFFEQMKGRGVRVIKSDDLKAVTPDAVSKDHFVIVDAVGVCEQDKTDSKPMEKKPAVSFEKLLQAVSFGNTEEAVLTSLAGRLARMEHRLSEDDDQKIRQLAEGLGVKDLSRQLVEAVNPDRIVKAASRRLQEIEAGSYRLTASDAENYNVFLNPYAPIAVTRANLPHWRQDDVIYFVTFRLADSLPGAKLDQWREQRRAWMEAHQKPWRDDEEKEYYRLFGKTVEQWLDRGLGSCVLGIPEIREIVSNAILHFETERYRLGKFVVAANHVHAIVRPLPGRQLSNILHSWKSYTAKQILKVEAASRRLKEKRQDTAATVWQKESYDRIIRSPEELYNIEQYIVRHQEYDLGEWEKRRDAASTAIQEQVRRELAAEAVKPLHDPKLRELLVEVKKKNEIVIDHVSQDEVIEAGFSADATERAKGIVKSFEQFIEDHKDEITALQILYAKPYKARLSFEDIKELADQIQASPNLWTESQLWQAYAALEKAKVKGAGGRRILTDLVSLVRFAIHQDNELIPFPDRVQANFNAWLAQQRRHSRESGNPEPFSEEQIHWLEMIRDHIAANLGIEPDDFEYAPFAQEGGLGKVYQIFGDELNRIIEKLNESLAA